jgi:hypothetical protein
MIGINLIFSFWICIWFILYILFSESIPSPLLALYIAFVVNVLELLYFIKFGIPFTRILQYVAMIALIKVVPIAIIYYYYNNRIKWRDDVISTISIFTLHNIYLLAKGTDFITVNKKIVHSIEINDKQTPLFKFFDTIYNTFKS